MQAEVGMEHPDSCLSIHLCNKSQKDGQNVSTFAASISKGGSKIDSTLAFKTLYWIITLGVRSAPRAIEQVTDDQRAEGLWVLSVGRIIIWAQARFIFSSVAVPDLY